VFSLKRLVKKIGYSLIRSTGELRALSPEFRHAPVLPAMATYSPWLTDAAFNAAYRRIRANTLVDLLRCYELWSLVRESAKLTAGDLLEVGVWRGGTGCLIATAAQRAGLRQTVFLCDTFAGVVKAGPLDTRYAGGEHADTSRAAVESLAASMGLDQVRILQGIFPEETGAEIAARWFRFVHVDVDVYQSAKDILEWVWPRLVTGGIVVSDDYGAYGCEGATRAVNEWAARQDALLIHNANGHGMLVKLAPPVA
jgi:O-methyltransferase